MVYPDEDKVGYFYNRAGDLYAIRGNKYDEKFHYIDSIKYNKYGLKSNIWYGNGTHAHYEYDVLQRLSILNSYTAYAEPLQSITYTYDPVSNITNMANGAQALSNGLGGSYNNSYQYDELYRLTHAEGNNGNFYTLNMAYMANGKIKYKDMAATYNLNGNAYTDSYHNDYQYFEGTNRLRDIESNNIPHHFEWDANGNMLMHLSPNYEERHHCWDEENRLMAIKDANHFGYYIYDAGGERTYKLNGTMGQTNWNGRWYDQPTPQMATLYASPYLVATPKGYTKHYYAGTERVASKLGGGGLLRIKYAISFQTPSPSHHIDETIQRKWEQQREPYHQIWGKCINSLVPEMLPAVELSNLYDYEKPQTVETAHYFYHPDHLGSASWITDSSGKAIQHLQYLPFGETRVDQRKTSWSTRYSFSAKEKDEESGYGYFGARYYDSDLSIWLSVDPMAAKYPSLSPYAYCALNPLILIDPNGEELVITGAAAEEATAQLQNKTKMKLTRDAETGKISYEGRARNKADRMLKEAIDHKDITVNIVAENSDKFTAHDGKEYEYEKDKEGLIGGGAYGGSTVSDDGSVNSYQYVSPQRMGEMDKRVGDTKSGGYMLHEVAEGFYSGQAAFKEKTGDAVGGSRYNAVHQQANQISLGGWGYETHSFYRIDASENKVLYKKSGYVRTHGISH
jgi:RHS repeat-associated protein